MARTKEAISLAIKYTRKYKSRLTEDFVQFCDTSQKEVLSNVRHQAQRAW